MRIFVKRELTVPTRNALCPIYDSTSFRLRHQPSAQFTPHHFPHISGEGLTQNEATFKCRVCSCI
jgi:hypothetical protein